MLPRRITKILSNMETQQTKQPMCNDCCGAKATRKPWRDKGDKARKSHLRKATKPGEIVSVDQLESSVPGFIGQMTGRLTNKRIVASTIFVDHASDLSMCTTRHQLHQKRPLKANWHLRSLQHHMG
jgi:hypothetical protein